MGDLVAKRWRAYGKDRLYVSTGAGGKVGWLDLVSKEVHLEAGADRQAFDQAVAEWRGESARSGRVADLPAPAPSPEQLVPSPAQFEEEPPPEAPTDEWVDLAGNRAGAGPREQAVALRQAAPRNSRRGGPASC